MFSQLLSYLKTGQQAPIAHATTPQVENSAGGYSWEVDVWTRLDRFLVLGASTSTYYASARSVALEHADAVMAAMDVDGARTVQAIVAVSQAGRAPRNDASILALAMCLKAGDLETRRAAAAAVPVVCRTGTHLFKLAAAVSALGGWGRLTRRAFAEWYQQADTDRLAYQVSKYRQREGWTHRDVLRKAHPVPATDAHGAVYRWITHGELTAGAPARLGLISSLSEQSTVAEVAHAVESYGLVREELPTHALGSTAVWDALLHAGRGMPMTAMLRNLAKMTSIGLISKGSRAERTVVRRLSDKARIRAARIHPLAVLVALNTYARGHGVKGSLKWTPSRQVLDALDRAFHLSFATIPKTGKRHMLAVDVSGSMGWSEVAGMTGITPRVGAAAMVMATRRVEPSCIVTAFSTSLQRLSVDPKLSLSKVQARFDSLPMGGTDCAQPMLYAARERIPVDTFVVYTDSETWYGPVHPAQALKRYRDQLGIPARLIVVGMVSNGFTIADPDDPGMLDVVGFDTTAPRVMADFTRGV